MRPSAERNRVSRTEFDRLNAVSHVRGGGILRGPPPASNAEGFFEEAGLKPTRRRSGNRLRPQRATDGLSGEDYCRPALRRGAANVTIGGKTTALPKN